jgi:isoprenylcysteine carboxyl methyltransferase (ICMT) family protein YpbQ
MVGERRAEELGLVAPEVVASRSRFYADTERVMGWDIGGTGFRIVLAASVADVVEEHLALDVKGFLAEHDLEIPDVVHWVSHPGGPKVLDAVRRALSLPVDALARSWRSLAAHGNLSSASVLHVLRDTLADNPAGSGEPALALAMGPGFCSELSCCAGEAAAAVTGQLWYTALVLAVGAERLAELRISLRHARWAFARGGIERGQAHYPWMVVLHVGLLAGCLAEVWLLDRPFVALLGWPMLALALGSQALRWWCIATLGRRWNTRVIVVPGLPLIERGPTGSPRTPTTWPWSSRA